MGEISLLLPRTDYMPAQDDYDVLDSILFSAGFRENGFANISEHIFRRYTISEDGFDVIPIQEIGCSSDYIDSKLVMYMQTEIPPEDSAKLASYGIRPGGVLEVDEGTYYSYQIDRRHLPCLAKMCPNGVRASRRIVEERSYFRFLNNGGNHGCDLTDWLTTEWEADSRIQSLLAQLLL